MRIGGAKLQPDQVWEIYQLAWNGISQGEIASLYGVPKTRVSSIKHGYSWWHVTGEWAGRDVCNEVASSVTN